MALFTESRPGIWEAVLSDGGPLYTETRLDHFVAEPFNALSALVFLGIALRWAWRLRTSFWQNLFFGSCIFLLAVGGIGGTLYHGTRASRWFHLMDVLPIALICAAVGSYLWGRLLRRRGWQGFALVLPMFLPLPWAYSHLPTQFAVSVSYLVYSMVVVVPLAITLHRTRYAHVRFVLAALSLFLLALLFRLGDSFQFVAQALPMGSHWLWHVFSAGAVTLVLEYFYQFTRERQA